MRVLHDVKKIYEEGGNIIDYFRMLDEKENTSVEDILISYDFQAGTYIQNYYENMEARNFYDKVAQEVQWIHGQLSAENPTICEVGVGEATTIYQVLEKMPRDIKGVGFDISWSRIKYAKKFIQDNSDISIELLVGDMFSAPLKDDSVDIVYTCHSVEPNGGREEDALRELYRITKNYLVLLEPGYKYASPKGKERMKKNGYAIDLLLVAEKLGYNIVDTHKLEACSNPLNPTEVIVIKKDFAENRRGRDDDVWCCPITHKEGIWKGERGDSEFYSPESMIAYPSVFGVTCLDPSAAIVATKYMDFI